MNILVIDDVEAVAMIVSRISAQGGWNSYYTDSTSNILGMIEDKKIHVVLCDYFMPVIGGLEVLRMIRAKYKQIPVIFFSGNTQGIDVKVAEELGIFKILAKPFAISELRVTLREAYQSQQPAG